MRARPLIRGANLPHIQEKLHKQQEHWQFTIGKQLAKHLRFGLENISLALGLRDEIKVEGMSGGQ